jgi:hypothetical protein
VAFPFLHFELAQVRVVHMREAGQHEKGLTECVLEVEVVNAYDSKS